MKLIPRHVLHFGLIVALGSTVSPLWAQNSPPELSPPPAAPASPVVTLNAQKTGPFIIDETRPDPTPLASQRRKFHLNHLYCFDPSPLGNRIPVVLLPGRAEEYQRNAWWLMLNTMAGKDTTFTRRFKLYVYLYDSNDSLGKQTNGFIHDLKMRFSQLSAAATPLVLVTYSLGGIIAREAMADPDIFRQVHTMFAIGVPFHGSPIFERDWFSYYIGARHFSPLRKTLDRAAYKVYLSDKATLVPGMRWDNFDRSEARFDLANEATLGRSLAQRAKAHRINEVLGQLDSDVAKKLTQTLPDNTLLQEAPNTGALKQKTIIYASYMNNPIIRRREQRPRSLQMLPELVGRSARALPNAFFGSLFPIYVFSVHWVLQFTNDQLANLPTFTLKEPFGHNSHLYAYNDGVVPLTSALFLPPSETPYDGDITHLAKAIDVQKARIFAGLDHIELGEYTDLPRTIISQDTLHPADGKRSPNAWLLYDIKQIFSANSP